MLMILIKYFQVNMVDQMKSSTFYFSHLITYFTIFAILGFNLIHGTVTQLPSHACQGEAITVECNITVPDTTNNNFLSNVIQFIVGTEDSPISDNAVNTGNTIAGSVNLVRLTAFANSSFSDSKNILGSITLSAYTMSDTGLLLGCSAAYFINGNSGTANTISGTVRLTPAAPPSPPSLLSISSSNIDPNTCSATVSLNWIPPSSTDRTVDRYYLSLQNGTTLETISAPGNSYSHSTNLLLDTVYADSVYASSCAGNSPPYTSHLNPINGFSLQNTPQIDYDDVNQRITINWELSDESTPLLIGYSLEYRMNAQSRSIPITKFSALSSIRTRTQPLPRFKYNSIPSDAIIFIRITQQCGQTYSALPPSIQSPLTRIETLTDIFPAWLPISITIPLILLISLVINLLLITIVVFLVRKIKFLNSKFDPSHLYEHIDLGKMCSSINSPTQQQSPHDYIPMSSVYEQESTQTTTQYANLK